MNELYLLVTITSRKQTRRFTAFDQAQGLPVSVIT